MKSGNKTEMRFFSNHPRLSSVLVRTSADEKRETFVYGQDGKVKSLPENMVVTAMSASADEIADSAGISNAIAQTSSSFVQNSKPLQPLPGYKFPVQNQPVPQAAAAEISVPEQAAKDAEQKTPEKSMSASPEQKENPLP